MASVGDFVANGAAGSGAAAGTACAAAAGATSGCFLELQPAQAKTTEAAPGSHGPIFFTGSWERSRHLIPAVTRTGDIPGVVGTIKQRVLRPNVRAGKVPREPLQERRWEG